MNLNEFESFANEEKWTDQLVEQFSCELATKSEKKIKEACALLWIHKNEEQEQQFDELMEEIKVLQGLKRLCEFSLRK